MEDNDLLIEVKKMFLAWLVEQARTYGHDGDYVEVRDFVRYCFEVEEERQPTDEELEPFNLQE